MWKMYKYSCAIKTQAERRYLTLWRVGKKDALLMSLIFVRSEQEEKVGRAEDQEDWRVVWLLQIQIEITAIN